MKVSTLPNGSQRSRQHKSVVVSRAYGGRVLHITAQPNSVRIYRDVSDHRVLDAVQKFDAKVADGHSVHTAYDQTLLPLEPAARARGLMRSLSKDALKVLSHDHAAEEFGGAIYGLHPLHNVDETPLVNLAHNIPYFTEVAERPPSFRRLVNTRSARVATLTVLAHILDSLPVENQEIELAHLLARADDILAEERTPEFMHALEHAKKHVAGLPRSEFAQALDTAHGSWKLAVFHEHLAQAEPSHAAEEAMEKTIAYIRTNTEAADESAAAREAFAQNFDRKTALARERFRARTPIALNDHAELAKNIGKLDEDDRYPALLALLRRTPMNRTAFEALAHSLEHIPWPLFETAKRAIVQHIAGEFRLTTDEPFLHKSYVAQHALETVPPRFGSTTKTVRHHVSDRPIEPPLNSELAAAAHCRVAAMRRFTDTESAARSHSEVELFEHPHEFEAHFEPIWAGFGMKAKLASQQHADNVELLAATKALARAAAGIKDGAVAAAEAAIRGGPVRSGNEKMRSAIERSKAEFMSVNGIHFIADEQPPRSRFNRVASANTFAGSQLRPTVLARLSGSLQRIRPNLSSNSLST